MNLHNFAGIMATIGLPTVSIAWVVYRDRRSDKGAKHRAEDDKLETLTNRVGMLERQVTGFKFYVLRLVGIMERHNIEVPEAPSFLEL